MQNRVSDILPFVQERWGNSILIYLFSFAQRNVKYILQFDFKKRKDKLESNKNGYL